MTNDDLVYQLSHLYGLPPSTANPTILHAAFYHKNEREELQTVCDTIGDIIQPGDGYQTQDLPALVSEHIKQVAATPRPKVKELNEQIRHELGLPGGDWRELPAIIRARESDRIYLAKTLLSIRDQAGYLADTITDGLTWAHVLPDPKEDP